jgi:hypothetical protein
LAAGVNLKKGNYMNKLLLRFGFLSLCFGLSGCGDGTLEIKSRSAAPAAPATPVVVIEKPNEETSTRETKIETRTPNGNTTRTTEIKTTNP